MARPVVTYTSTTTVANQPVGGLPGGWFVTTTGSGSLELRPTSAPATVSDTKTAYTYRPSFAQTATGVCYYLAGSASGASTVRLYRLSQASGVLTVTTVGDILLSANNTTVLSVSADGTEAVIGWASGGSYASKVVSTSTGTTITDATTADWQAAMQYAVAAGGGNAFQFVSNISEWRLFNASGVIDTYAIPYQLRDVSRLQMKPLSNDRYLYVGERVISPSPTYHTLYIAVISTAGGVISVEWDTVVTSSWLNANAYDQIATTFGDLGAIVVRYDYGAPTDPQEFYIVDTAAQAVYGTEPRTEAAGYGVWDNTSFFAGADTLLWWENIGTKVKVWDIAIPPLKFRRAIGTSYRLRQRQTPYIR